MTGTKSPSPNEGPAVTLHHLDLLASAIAGRALVVAALEGSGDPWTDGTTVYIDTRDEPQLRRAAVAVQASLLGAESLQPAVVTGLQRRPSLLRRYLSLEGHRALSAHERFLPLGLRALVDHPLAARSASPADSLVIATSQGPLPDPPSFFGTIRPRALRVESSACDPDSANPHVERRHRKGVLDDFDPDDDDDLVIDLTSPVGGGGGVGALLKRLFGEGRTTGSGPPGADTPTHRSLRPDRAAGAVAPSAAPAPFASPEWAFARGTFTYPEWDAARRRYRPDWCTVNESVPTASTHARLRPPDTHAFRRSLGRLGREFEQRHRQPEGDDIDLDAVVEARVDLLAGSASDEAVYLDAVRARRELSVLVLLDVSGSAGEPSSTGPPVHEHQRKAAAALAHALAELGDRVALYGFRSQGRAAVQVLAVKRFADRLDSRTFERLGGLEPAAYTRLGAAIRHGTQILERDAGTAKRLLMVLSDGFAYDHGYEPAYGKADARRALAEARHRGIGAVCCSLGAATDANDLSRVFGTAAYAAVPSVERLPGVVGPLFASALRSAELQRRRTQRRGRTKEPHDVTRRPW